MPKQKRLIEGKDVSLDKLMTPHCPKCKQEAVEVEESIPAQATILVEPDGSWVYAGDSRMIWDEQAPVLEDGKLALWCEDGHRWLSATEGR
jgi:hypothetical protein